MFCELLHGLLYRYYTVYCTVLYRTVLCTVLWAGQVYQKKSWHTVLADSAVSCSCALRAHVEYISVSCVDHDMLFVSGATQGNKKGMYR